MNAADTAPVCHVCDSRLGELWATATDTEYGTSTDRFGYYLCRDCDCLSIDPLPAAQLDLIYPPTYYSFASGGESAAGRGPVGRIKDRLDLRSYRRTVGMLATESPRILDVGGGTGDISSRFIDAGGAAEATVIDLDPTSIDVARSRGLQGFAGRIEDFRTEQRFDLALLLNLIEHVPDPAGVLASVGRLMDADGLIWVQTPDFRALDARVFRHRNWAGYHCPRHFVLFSEPGLRRILERAGLEVVSFERNQGGGFWAQSLLGLPRHRRALRPSESHPLASGGRPPEQLPRPLIRSRAFGPLAAVGAAFDIATRRLREVSQVVVLARPRS